MSQMALQILVGTALTDPKFRHNLLDGRRHSLLTEFDLTDKEREAIERFRGEMLTVRRELREVKRALREDIDRLDAWLKFANIGAVPLLLGTGAVGWALVRRRRKN